MQVVISKPNSTEKINSILDDIKSYRFFIILLIFIVLGMLCGVLSVKNVQAPFDKILRGMFESFLLFREESGFVKLFFNSFITGFTLMLFIVFSGMGASGMIILPSVMFFRGFGTSVISGFLYRDYSLSGIAFADLILLPSVLALDFLLLYVCNDAMKLSLSFCGCLRDVSTSGLNMRSQCVTFVRKVLWCTVILIVVSLVESLLTACLIKYFSF